MKRIAYYVIGMHMLFVLWSALWMPSKKVDKKPLQVRTVVHAPPPMQIAQPVAIVKADVKKMGPAPAVQRPTPTPAMQKPTPIPAAQKPAPVKPTPKPSPVKPTAKPSPAPAKKSAPVAKSGPVVPANLVRELQESIAKIDQTSHKDSPKALAPNSKLPNPKMVPQLKIDEESAGEESIFVASLVQCLQETLDLPEFGEVKVEIVLKCDGSFVKMKVLQSQSDRNRKFLEQELKTMSFPPFTGELKNEKEHTFVITFCNH
ncbi:MAG: hypothetical protein JSS30_04910 [Verrucomicrobia bacterium]|nr:hypothetical protein [Verrucomicrobiota bacterium]